MKPRKKVNYTSIANTSQTEEGITPMAVHTSTKFGMFHRDQSNNDSWIIDIGSIDHTTNDPSKILKIHTSKLNKVNAANRSEAPIIDEGYVKVPNSMNLDSALVVP